MHIPKTMKMGSHELIHQFIETFSFGAIISEQLEANHLPFLLKRSEGSLVRYMGISLELTYIWLHKMAAL